MIVTFYANRGGVGRTMALANVAAVLAWAGFDVVIINWDLDAPGIGVAHYFLESDERQVYARHPGMIQLLHEYKQRATIPWDELSEDGTPPAPLVSIDRYLYVVKDLPQIKGSIRLLGPWHHDSASGEGRQEGGPEFDWLEFYRTWRGYDFFEWLRQQLAGPRHSTFILIDAPAGGGMVSRMLTRHLADLIVLFCVPNNQNIDGLERLLDALAHPSLREFRSRRPLDLLVVPSRIARSRSAETNAFEQQIERLMSPLGPLPFDHRQVRELAVPHVTAYSGRERLAFLELMQPGIHEGLGARERRTLQRMFTSYAHIALIIAAVHSCRAFERARRTFSDRGLITESLARQPLFRWRQALGDQLRRLIGQLDTTVDGAMPGRTRSGAPVWQSFAYPDARPAEQLAMQAGAPDKAEPLPAYLATTARLLVLSEPGLGKSWLCMGLAYHAAHVALGERVSFAGWDEAAQAMERWLGERRLFPLFIELRALGGAYPILDTPEQLWDWLEAQTRRHTAAPGKAAALSASALAAGLRAEAAGGRVLWLLDGLDELDQGTQQIVRERLIPQLEAQHPACPIVLTCRTSAYRRLSNPLKSNWRVVALEPMGPQRQLKLLQGYFPHAPSQAAALLQQLNANPVLHEFTASPLHLLYLATALEHEEPPASRTQLHLWSLELILRHLQGALAEEFQRQAPELRVSEAELPLFLGYLGYHAQRAWLEDNRRSAALSAQQLITGLADYLQELAPSPGPPRARALALVRALAALSNGIFQRDVGGDYHFTHSSLREYLAGRHLASGPAASFAERARAALRAGHGWEPVVLHACAQLAAAGRVTPVTAFVEQLLATDERAELHCAVAILSALSELSPTVEATPAELWDRAAQRVLEALSISAPPSLAPADAYERAQLGALLDRLGSPTCGVRGETIVIEWRTIAAGEFWIGSDPQNPASYGASGFTPPPATIYAEAPPRRVVLPAFRIARHPVTNAQWRRYLRHSGAPEPAHWSEPRLNGGSQPVVGVSWGEAQQFCAWLSGVLGFRVFLPSEAQWEGAARGVSGRVRPWGDQWQDHANTAETGFGAPSVVGSFPAGASPDGVEDLVGNVLEWTASPWDAYSTDGGTSVCEPLAPPALVVARGGSWNLPREFARGAARSGFDPGIQESDLGFRLAADPPTGEAAARGAQDADRAVA